ncbi:EAL domain-containing protein [Gallaecimonas xiamenensis]|uniref:diguanylate cyclase n=1 Tax=Gallaecimonas xiamenensis 3-C-1 TaxID=745411 RepID=K2KIW6_9GAMM|nr:EAL domain-containing protein [Gallaecimonas xiamenensis]EKE77185.1 diguanylate cyclase [Gallaecimonas xiamenensis 3-C-1]
MHRISLTNRIAVLAVATVLVTGILVQWLTFHQLARGITSEQQQLLQARAANLQQSLDSYQDDILLLASLGEVKDWLADPDRPPQSPSLTLAWLSVMENTPDYFQARILDEEGMELLKVVREEDGRLHSLPLADLQDKSDRDYYLASLPLGRGEFYISPLNLNQEFGRIQIPHIPTVRLMAPVFSNQGKRLGFVALNVDFRFDLNRYLLDVGSESYTYLVNEKGQVLFSPQPDESFAFELGQDLRIGELYPALAELWAQDEGERLTQVKESLASGQKVFFANRIDYTGQRSDRYWYVIRALPRDFLLAEALQFRNFFFLQLTGLVLVMFILLTVGVRRLLYPLRLLGKATSQVARGNFNTSLPPANSKELRRLTDDFSHMVQRLKEREAEIIQNKDRFALFLSKVPCEVAIFDMGMRYIAASDDWIESHDLAGIQYKGRIHYDLFPDESEEWRVIHARSLRGESQKRSEDSFMVGDRVIWLRWEVIPWFEQGDRQGGIIVFQENITERKLLEASLQESENLLRTTIDNAPDGMAIVDLNLQWQQVNPALCRELGCAANDLLDRTVISMLGHNSKERLRQQLVALGREEQDKASLDLTFTQEFQDDIILQASVSAVRGKGGQLRHYVFQMQNVTLLRELEAQQKAASERLALATRAGKIGIWEYVPHQGLLTWDSLMYSIYRLEPDESQDLMARWRGRVLAEDLPDLLTRFEDTLNLGQHLDSLFRIRLPDGALRYIRTMAEPQLDEAGMVKRVVGCNWDVTDFKRSEQALFEEKERLSVTLGSIGDAVVCTDAAGRVSYFNHVAEELLGWPLDEAMGWDFDRIFTIYDERTDNALPNPVLQCIEENSNQHPAQDMVMVNRYGKRFDIISSAAPVRDSDGLPQGAVMVFQDMTRTRALQRELSHAAAHDALTGLLNRAQFEQSLERCIDKVHRSGKVAQFCFFDLDSFKILNDSAGHSAGDALLVELGQQWRQLIRSDDVLARLGGDEFGLLLEHCNQDKARQIAEEMLAAAKKLNFRWEGQDYDVSACVGIASITPATQSLAEVMSHADVACYAAKSSGRAKVCIYNGDDLAQLNHQELMMASKLKAAIQEEKFMLYCQGMEAFNGDERFVELLLRLKSDDGGVIGPAAFIPAAERYDLMEHLDLWVLDQVLVRQAQLLADAKVDCYFVNLSANSLSSELFAKQLLDKLTNSPLGPSRVCFEITETALINQMSNATRLVQQIRTIGGRIAIDDFGSGLSSFAYLRHFQVDFIKIDGCFVQSAAHNPLDRTIISSISNIAHKMQAQSIAEWVEDDVTATLLHKMGLDYGQGFYFGRPAPLAEFLREQGDQRQATLGYGDQRRSD